MAKQSSPLQTHTRSHTRRHTDMHIHTHTHTHTHTLTHTQTRTHTHAHAHTHTHTHTHTSAPGCSLCVKCLTCTGVAWRTRRLHPTPSVPTSEPVRPRQ